MIKNIIFDFDGVILESNDVKIDGFYKLFEEFGNEKANLASTYFATNAGLSRYDVIEYFFTEILNEIAEEEKLALYAKKYSHIVKDKVLESEFVSGCREFLIDNNKYNKYNVFIVSSSAENDLKYICEKLNINSFFKDILGSPTKKAINIKKIITKYNLNKSETVYIGDSLNDYQATLENDLIFIGRNSGVYDFNKIKNITVIKDLKEINTIVKDLKC